MTGELGSSISSSHEELAKEANPGSFLEKICGSKGFQKGEGKMGFNNEGQAAGELRKEANPAGRRSPEKRK
jgi:hypothetical protein